MKILRSLRVGSWGVHNNGGVMESKWPITLHGTTRMVTLIGDLEKGGVIITSLNMFSGHTPHGCLMCTPVITPGPTESTSILLV